MRQLETSSVNNEMYSFDMWRSYVFIDPVWIHVTLNCYISRKQEIPAGVILRQSAIGSELTRKIHPYIFMQSNKQLLFTFFTDIYIYIYIKLQSLIRIYYVNVSILSTNQRVPGWTQLAGAAQNVKCICQIWLTST
jgi:hypothetical protein